MRTKFEAPSEPGYHEQIFIEKMEQYKTIKKDTLELFVFGCKKPNGQRALRNMIEKYNNYRFENIIPLGKIVTLETGWFELVRSTHDQANKVRNKAKYDLIAAAIAYRHTRKILGDRINDDQVSMYDVVNLSLNELMLMADELQE
jgi:hypothetical protein